MPPQVDADILIIGAGIAGLTAAAKLRDVGVTVEIIDRAESLRTTGAGLVLHPNALAHLRFLEPKLFTAGRLIDQHLIIDPDGESTVVDWRAVWPAGQVPLAIHRLELAKLMVAYLLPMTVRWSTAPYALTESRSCVTVVFRDGRSGRYRLVVGADGSHSWTRRVVDECAVLRKTSSVFWRTTVPAYPPFDFPEWRVWRGKTRMFGAMPIGSGLAHLFLGRVEETNGRSLSNHRDELVGLAAELDGLTELLADVRFDEDGKGRRSLALAVSRWVRGRVALVGDAAHVVPPATTQGGALAIEDASVLADEVARHGSVPEALRAFERRRHRRVAEFERLARLYVSLMQGLQANHPVLRFHRGTLVPRDGSPWFRRLYEPLLPAA